jgi:S-adenosylmethionine synthetase
MQIVIEHQPGPTVADRAIEIVERKGLGHPDTICDMISEQASLALSRHYLDKFGMVLHHNVDKTLLAAGQSEAKFGGGRIIEPITIILSGRATSQAQGQTIPVSALVEASASEWLRKNLHALDLGPGVRFQSHIQPGSPELVELSMRKIGTSAPLANDTSCGVGFAPLTSLERTVLAIERRLNSPLFKGELPASGEDIKVMGVRTNQRVEITVSCAFISRYIEHLIAYRDAKEKVLSVALETARSMNDNDISVNVNAADDPASGSIFLTLGGTSAEAGDDGETGRGNRANGLITPLRPMSLEAVAGKNPVTHVGKLYNIAANRMAAAIVAEVAGVSETECYLVSRIGAPVDKPAIAHIRVRSKEGGTTTEIQRTIAGIAEREIAAIPRLWRSFVEGQILVA